MRDLWGWDGELSIPGKDSGELSIPGRDQEEHGEEGGSRAAGRGLNFRVVGRLVRGQRQNADHS